MKYRENTLVVVKRVERYRWSSYRATAGLEPAPSWLMTTGWVLGQFGRRRREAQAGYAEFVKAGVGAVSGNDSWKWPTVVHTLFAMGIDFEWDEHKRQLKLRKHGIDFADAVEVFYDDLACGMGDPDHHNEHRFVLTGIDAFGRVLVVVYTQPDKQTIRIISARPATTTERRHYERG